MAQPTNTFDSYDSIGTREDLSDIIYNISPTDTPFMSAAGKTSCANTYFEWQTDALAAASTSNARIEGDDFGGDSRTATTRVGNYTQISDKEVVVSGTQEVTNKAGRAKEMAYQIAKAAKELKRDMESIITGNQARVVGDATTARKLRSLESWYSTNVSRGTNGASGSTTTAATDATTAGVRAFTEDLLQTVIRTCWDNGAEPSIIMTGSFNRNQLSGFSGNATRTVDAASKKLMASVSVYASDFGDLKVVPNRFSRSRTVHLLDPEYVKVAYLRPFKTVDIARTGDSEKKMLITEYSLQVSNEAALGVIADLTTA